MRAVVAVSFPKGIASKAGDAICHFKYYYIRKKIRYFLIARENDIYLRGDSKFRT